MFATTSFLMNTTIQRILQYTSVLGATSFAGISLYINMTVLPMIRSLPSSERASTWKYMYDHTALLQAGLAVLSTLSNAALYVVNPLYLVPSVAMGLIPVFTLAVMGPGVNKQLMLLADTKDADEKEVDTQLAKWQWMHAIRTGLSWTAAVTSIAL